MGLVTSLLYLALFWAAGLLAARWAVPGASLGLCLPLGCGYCMALLAALPALLALGLGFGRPAVLLAALAAAVLAVLIACCLARRPRPKREKDSAALWLCLLPLLVLTAVLLYTHILHSVDGAYHTGQSTYGDTAMHAGVIKYLSLHSQFPPEYPMLAGHHRFGYPFLCETVSAVFLLLGADLRSAYLLPMLPAFAAVYGGLWQLARHVLGHNGKASLAYWLFFMGSGFGFVYFLGDAESFRGIFTGYYTTPTNYVQENILWVNPVVDMLIPQRATLFGWSVLFPALVLLWRFCYVEERRLWLPLALLVLPLPLLQTHSALALVLVCLAGGIYTLLHRPHSRAVLLPWLGLAAVCGAVWLPEMWGTVLAQAVGGVNMLRPWFNWVNNNGDGTLKDNYLWFYIKNIGLVYLLLIPAFVHAGKKQRWLYGGGLLCLLLGELVLFQTNPYDNNKLLFIWHLLGCVLVAGLVWDLCARLAAGWRAAVLGTVCFLGMFGSVLTVGRELVSDYVHWDAGDIALAAYVDANAAPEALFLSPGNHQTPVFSLAGRRILCGWGGWIGTHGIDYSAEASARQALYEQPSEDLLRTWGIDYALFDEYTYADFAPDEGWYAARYPLWYSGPGGRIYKTS